MVKTIKILCLILIIPLIINTWVRAQQLPGIDFYHYWGVAKAHQFSQETLQSPYIHHGRYFEILKQYAADTPDQKLREATDHREALDLTGTPLLYAAFAGLPENYSTALTTFRLVQLAAFITAVVLIGCFSNAGIDYLLIALILSASFLPFILDLKVSNLNSIQLLAVTGLTLFVDKARAHPRKRVFFNSIVLVFSLIFLNLLKPNLLLVALSLLTSFFFRYGLPKIRVLLPISGAFCALIILTSNLFFGSSRVWLDWYDLVAGSKDRLAYPVLIGNCSIPLMISRLSGLDLGLAIMLVAAGLGASLMLVMTRATDVKSMAKANRWQLVSDLFKNTPLCVGFAIAITIALSPLVWLHYYTLLLLPTLWLLSVPWGWKPAPWLGGVAIVLASGGIPNSLVSFMEVAPAFAIASYVTGWLCLWLGLLGILFKGLKTAIYQCQIAQDPDVQLYAS
jgi:hypothetical protein